MRTAVIILLLLITIPAAGQAACGFGVPCQPAPWRVPVLPTLNSPTPNVFSSGNPGATSTPIPTSTPQPTLTPFFDTDGIGQAVSTMSAISAGTTIPITNWEGTPVALELLDVEQYVGYVKGIDTGIAGPFQPLLNLSIVGFLMLFLVKGSGFLLPIFMAIFGFVRKIVQLVLDFLPL
jgi:hypothetical protein